MKSSIHIILLAIASFAVVSFAAAWRSARHDAAQLTATLASQKSIIDQAADREKQRDQQLASTLAAIAAQKRAVQTPQQAAKEIPSILPPLPLPISIQIPPLLPPSKPAADLPVAVSIPQADLKPLYDALQDCRASALETTSLTKNLADEKLQNTALTRDRDTAVTAARGGTLRTRLIRNAKWFALGLAVAALTSEAAPHHH